VDAEEIEVPPSPRAELGLRWEGLEFAEQPVLVLVAAAAAEEAAVAGGKGMPPASVVSSQRHLYY
jgi:hypothetical protein